MPHACLMNTCIITLTGSFLLHPIGNKWLLSLEYQCRIIHVHANTLCTGRLCNKLPYHVLQLPPHVGQPIHLPNEMVWKLWIMAIFQSKRNKPLIATWPLGNFNREALQHRGNHLLLPLLYFGFKLQTLLIWCRPDPLPPHPPPFLPPLFCPVGKTPINPHLLWLFSPPSLLILLQAHSITSKLDTVFLKCFS